MKYLLALILFFSFCKLSNAQQGIYNNAPSSSSNCKDPVVNQGDIVTYYIVSISSGNVSPIFSVTYTATSKETPPNGLINSIGNQFSNEFISYCRNNSTSNRNHSTSYYAKRSYQCVKDYMLKHGGELFSMENFNFSHSRAKVRMEFALPYKSNNLKELDEEYEVSVEYNSNNRKSTRNETSYNTYNNNTSQKKQKESSVDYTGEFSDWSDNLINEVSGNNSSSLDESINDMNNLISGVIEESEEEERREELERERDEHQRNLNMEKAGDEQFMDGNLLEAKEYYRLANYNVDNPGNRRVLNKIRDVNDAIEKAKLTYFRKIDMLVIKKEYENALKEVKSAKRKIGANYPDLEYKTYKGYAEKLAKKNDTKNAVYYYYQAAKIKDSKYLQDKIKSLKPKASKEYLKLAKETSDINKKYNYLKLSLSYNPSKEAKDILPEIAEQMGDFSIRNNNHSGAVDYYLEALKYSDKQTENKLFKKLEKAKAVFTDPRDGKKYGTVIIDGNRWMVNDLNYEPIEGSRVVDTEDNTFQKSRSDSIWPMQTRVYNYNNKNKVCPNGWRLVNKDDIEGLVKLYHNNDRDAAFNYSPTSNNSLFDDMNPGGKAGLNFPEDFAPRANTKTKTNDRLYWTDKKVLGLQVVRNKKDKITYRGVRFESLWVKKYYLSVRCVEDKKYSNYKLSQMNWYNIGMILWSEKKWNSVAKCLEYSIKFDKDSANYMKSHLYLGQCYYLLRQYEKADIYLRKSLDFVKSDPAWAHYIYSFIYENKNDLIEASESIEKAEKENLKKKYLHSRKSWLALLLNKPQTAVYESQKQLKLEPGNLSAKSKLALGYILNNEYPKAKAIINKDIKTKKIIIGYIFDLKKVGIEHPDFKKLQN